MFVKEANDHCHFWGRVPVKPNRHVKNNAVSVGAHLFVCLFVFHSLDLVYIVKL